MPQLSPDAAAVNRFTELLPLGIYTLLALVVTIMAGLAWLWIRWGLEWGLPGDGAEEVSR